MSILNKAHFISIMALFFLSCKNNIDMDKLYFDAKDSSLKYKSNHQLVTGKVVSYYPIVHKKISSIVEYKNGYIDGMEEFYTNTGEMFLNGSTFRNISPKIKNTFNTNEIKLWYEGSIKYTTCELKSKINHNKIN